MPRLTGLYLMVQVGDRSVDRALAGNPATTLVAADIDRFVHDVDTMLMGTTVLAFEGDHPTQAALLDDAPKSRFAQKPFLDAAARGDLTSAVCSFLNPL